MASRGLRGMADVATFGAAGRLIGGPPSDAKSVRVIETPLL